MSQQSCFRIYPYICRVLLLNLSVALYNEVEDKTDLVTSFDAGALLKRLFSMYGRYKKIIERVGGGPFTSPVL